MANGFNLPIKCEWLKRHLLYDDGSIRASVSAFVAVLAQELRDLYAFTLELLALGAINDRARLHVLKTIINGVDMVSLSEL